MSILYVWCTPLQAFYITKHKLSKLSNLSLSRLMARFLRTIFLTLFFFGGETCLNYTQSSLQTLHKQLFSRSLVHNFEKNNVWREGKGRSVGALWRSTSTYTRTMLFLKKILLPQSLNPHTPKKKKNCLIAFKHYKYPIVPTKIATIKIRRSRSRKWKDNKNTPSLRIWKVLVSPWPVAGSEKKSFVVGYFTDSKNK